MPFQFLDEDSNAQAPSVKPVGASPSPAPKFKFLDEPSASTGGFKFSDGPDEAPTAKDLPGLMAGGYKPNNDDLRTIFDAEENRTLGEKVKAVGSNAAKGLWNTVKAPILATGELAQKPSIEHAGRTLASIPEGVVSAASGLVGMIGKPVLNAYDYFINDSWLRNPDEQFEKWKLDYLAHNDVGVNPLPQYVTPDEARGGVLGQKAFEPYPHVSETVATAASIPMFEAGAMASGAGKLLAPSPVSTVSRAGARTANVAGKVATKTGEALEAVGAVPERIAETATRFVAGPELAEKVGKAVKANELTAGALGTIAGVPGGKILLAAKGAKSTGAALKNAGEFAQRVATADPTSPFGRLYMVAKDATAPDWMRSVANSWLTKLPAEAANVVVTGAKSAAAGGIFGAGLGLVSGMSPEELGQSIGTGAGFGVLTSAVAMPRIRKLQILEKSAARVDKFVQDHIADGIPIEGLKNVGNDAMTWSALGEDILGNGWKIRFAPEGENSPLPKNVYKQAGVSDDAGKTIWINTSAKRDPAATVLHELLHPIYEGEVANRPELKLQIDQALKASGRTLDIAKNIYGYKLLAKDLAARGEKDPIKIQQQITQYIAGQDQASLARTGDANAWMYSEILSEAGARSLYGSHPITDVISPSITASALEGAKSFFEKLGVQFKSKGVEGKPSTILPGFENVIDSPELRKTILKLVKAQKEHLPGLTESQVQGVKINPELWGKHPGATLDTRANGVKGSDFVVQKPDGSIVTRPKGQVKRILKSRRKEVNDMFPGDTTPLPETDTTPVVSVRRTPSGLVERSGTQLGPNFEKLTSFGAKTKAAARDIERAIAGGEARSGWYQQIGESPDWKASVQRDTGALEAQYKEFIPYGFKIDKQGNLLVQNYSLTAFDRKAAEWSQRKTGVGLQLWGGDIAKFKTDVAQYLKNHTDGLPGEANNLGIEKKNVINAFLVGGNRTFEAKNPLRPSLKGADRQGVVRSYRLDRLETVEPHTAPFVKPEYRKQVVNLSPDAAEPTREFILKMKPDEFFDFGAKISAESMKQDSTAPSIQTTAEMAAAKDPDLAKWQAAYQQAKDEARALHQEIMKDPSSLVRRQKEMMGVGQKAQFFQEGLKQIAKLEGENKIGGVFSPDVRDTNKDHIVQAATRMPDGKIFTGSMHAFAYAKAEEAGYVPDQFNFAEDGFLTSTGQFVDRSEAKQIAMKANQIDVAKAKEFDTTFAVDKNQKTSSSQTPLEAQAFNEARRFSPDVEKKLSKMPGARADEVPEGKGDYWLTRDGKFISVGQHQQLADQLGVTVEDLYHGGLLRTVIRGDDSEAAHSRVWLSSLQEPPSMTPKQQQAIEKLKDRDFAVNAGDRRFSPDIMKQTESPEFKRWFSDSKVVDAEGKPKLVFSGHYNSELYGNKYNPKATTAGAFYATESPEIASNYAMGKMLGGRKDYAPGAQYLFQNKNGKWGKKLFQIELTPEQQQKVREFFSTEANGVYDIEKYWKDNAPYDPDSRKAVARGGLKNLEGVWQFLEHMGFNIAYNKENNAEGTIPITERQVKNTFEQLLDHIGVPWKSKEWATPGVFPLFLQIRNPIDTSQPFPPDLLKALEQASKHKRKTGYEGQWTKDYPFKQWVQDIKDGDEYWSTHIPTDALPILKKFGYDGVKELGNKGKNPDADRQINWIAFNPEQIKSASGNKGTFDPANPDIRFSPDVPIFSQADKVIEEKFSGESMPKAQLAAMLRNPSNRVKADELKWSGLDDFLKGPGRVSKEEVQNFLKANNVQVKEVVKSEKGELAPIYVDPSDFTWETKKAETIRFNTHAPDPEEMVIVGKHPEEDTYFIIRKAVEDDHVDTSYVLYGDWGDPFAAESIHEAKLTAAQYVKDSLQDREVEDNKVNGGDTQYGSYQLPGGKNYREILFTLPSKTEPRPIVVPLTSLPKGYELIHDSHSPANRQWGVIPPGQVHARSFAGNHPTQEEAIEVALRRVNENRVDEAERKWSESIRGFRSGHFDESNILAHARVNDREVEDFNVDERKQQEIVGNPKSKMLFAEEIQSDWHQRGRDKGYAVPPLGPEEIKKKVPDAPFKSTWHEMAFRRLVAKAVEEGKDLLGWTTGEQQAERYDLSKQVKLLSVLKEGNGKYLLYVEGKDGSPAFRDTQGFSEHGSKSVTSAEMEELIGKEATKNMIAGAEQRFEAYLKKEKLGANTSKRNTDPRWYDSTPADLKVGGEGMEGFYDKILVDYANKFGKKFGAKVKDVQISQNQGTTTVHALPITPEMKTSLLKNGISLFSPDTPDGNNPSVLYHGTRAEYKDADISTGKRMFGIHLTTDKEAAETYGKVKTFKLAKDARSLDLSDGDALWSFMESNGILDKDALKDVDLERYVKNGQVFQYDISSKTHFADDVATTVKSLGYDLVVLPDDLAGKGDNIAYVVVNPKVLTGHSGSK